MKDKRGKAYEKIQEELDIPIAEIKNKIIGLYSQLISCEVAKQTADLEIRNWKLKDPYVSRVARNRIVNVSRSAALMTLWPLVTW